MVGTLIDAKRVGRVHAYQATLVQMGFVLIADKITR